MSGLSLKFKSDKKGGVKIFTLEKGWGALDVIPQALCLQEQLFLIASLFFFSRYNLYLSLSRAKHELLWQKGVEDFEKCLAMVVAVVVLDSPHEDAESVEPTLE